MAARGSHGGARKFAKHGDIWKGLNVRRTEKEK